MSTPLRVVVIDDDPVLRESLVEGLPLLGDFVVQQASDGDEGLLTIAATIPDCIVADIRMPHLDGYHFVRAIRGDPATAGIPLILLSALAQDQDRLDGLLSGADIYLYKPVMLETLVQAIDAAIRISQSERDARTQMLGEGGSSC